MATTASATAAAAAAAAVPSDPHAAAARLASVCAEHSPVARHAAPLQVATSLALATGGVVPPSGTHCGCLATRGCRRATTAWTAVLVLSMAVTPVYLLVSLLSYFRHWGRASFLQIVVLQAINVACATLPAMLYRASTRAPRAHPRMRRRDAMPGSTLLPQHLRGMMSVVGRPCAPHDMLVVPQQAAGAYAAEFARMQLGSPAQSLRDAAGVAFGSYTAPSPAHAHGTGGDKRSPLLAAETAPTGGRHMTELVHRSAAAGAAAGDDTRATAGSSSALFPDDDGSGGGSGGVDVESGGAAAPDPTMRAMGADFTSADARRWFLEIAPRMHAATLRSEQRDALWLVAAVAYVMLEFPTWGAQMFIASMRMHTNATAHQGQGDVGDGSGSGGGSEATWDGNVDVSLTGLTGSQWFQLLTDVLLNMAVYLVVLVAAHAFRTAARRTRARADILTRLVPHATLPEIRACFQEAMRGQDALKRGSQWLLSPLVLWCLSHMIAIGVAMFSTSDVVVRTREWRLDRFWGAVDWWGQVVLVLCALALPLAAAAQLTRTYGRLALAVLERPSLSAQRDPGFLPFATYVNACYVKGRTMFTVAGVGVSWSLLIKLCFTGISVLVTLTKVTDKVNAGL